MDYIKTIFSWNSVTFSNTICLFKLGCLMYLIIFKLLNNVFPTNLQKKIDKIQYKCLISCNKPICYKMSSLRDTEYFWGCKNNIDLKSCIFTSWEFSHILFHMYIGYNYNIYYSIVISILFEIFESKIYKCGSYLDIGWNFIGFLLGAKLRCLF